MTYNPICSVDESKISHLNSFERVVYEVMHELLLVNLFRVIEGKRGVWHCRSHTLMTSQEACLVTGLDVARQLGGD